jgi:bifunctional non-homologous end joining protein LigD
MPHTYAPCIPIAGKAVPARPEWFHEIKYDGYRLIVIREDERVRLITRNGHDSEQSALTSSASFRDDRK